MTTKRTEKENFIENLKNKLPQGSFAKNVVTLMTGTAFSQLLMILVSPILTRLYSPEDFGVFALYTSILGMMGVVANWRYQLAIVLPDKDEEAANLLVLSMIIALFMSCLSLVGVALLRHQCAALLGSPALAPWLWFLPLSTLAVGLFQAFNYWSTRRNQFKRLAVRQITQSLTTAVSQTALGFTSNLSSGGLVSGYTLGQLAATTRLGIQIWKEERRIILSFIRLGAIKRLAKYYRRFPIYDTWSALLDTGATVMPALILGYYYSPIIVGYYSLGQRVLTVPISVIGGAISQTFFPRAAEAYRRGNLDKITLEMFQRLFSFGLVPFMLIALIAPQFFELVFGYGWRTAGEYVRWISFWLLMMFVGSPISTVYSVLQRQRQALIINVAKFSLRFLALVIGGLSGYATLTLALLGLTGALIWLVNCNYILFMAGVPSKVMYISLARQSLKCTPYLLMPTVILYISQSDIMFVLSGIVSGIVFFAMQIRQLKRVEITR